MKKLIIPMLMLCIGHAGMMKAADTDVSAIDNVVYIESFQASPGTTALELSIKMKNTAAIRGFQFDLELPEGVAPVENGGEYMYWLNADRAPMKAGGQFYHTLEVTKQTDGSYRFLCGAQADKTFTGNDGEVAVIQVDIAAGMAVGDYTISLKNIKLTETDISKYYTTDKVQSTLTITASSDGRVVLDETSTTAPEAATNVNVRVKRTINANEWSTICLPFAMSEAQLQMAFGDGVQLGDFNDYEVSDDGESISVKFNTATAIVANHPYIIKVVGKVSEFTVDGVDITPVNEPTINFGTNRRPHAFIGCYKAGTVIGNGCLFLSGGNFWYSVGTTKIKAFRAYFNFDDLLPDFENQYATARMQMVFTDETDGVQTVAMPTQQKGQVFDLQGRRVSTPARGLYIRDGKKVIIK